MLSYNDKELKKLSASAFSLEMLRSFKAVCMGREIENLKHEGCFWQMEVLKLLALYFG
jgi:hypothetical protein